MFVPPARLQAVQKLPPLQDKIGNIVKVSSSQKKAICWTLEDRTDVIVKRR